MLLHNGLITTTFKHIITYPISSKYLNWIGFVTTPGAEGTRYPHKWATDGSREELVSHFAGWEPEVDEMISVGVYYPLFLPALLIYCHS